MLVKLVKSMASGCTPTVPLCSKGNKYLIQKVMRKRGAVDCRRDGFLCSLGEETKSRATQGETFKFSQFSGIWSLGFGFKLL
jgi:hypothetical protein